MGIPLVFSDEYHLCFGPQGTPRKPGERYCQDRIHDSNPKGDSIPEARTGHNPTPDFYLLRLLKTPMGKKE